MREALRYLIIEQVIGRVLVLEVAELLAKGYSTSEISEKLGLKKSYVQGVKNSLLARGARGVYLGYLAKYIPVIRALPAVAERDGYGYRCRICNSTYRDVTTIYLHVERRHGDLVDDLLRTVVQTVKFRGAADIP